jgi:hypothetical protein
VPIQLPGIDSALAIIQPYAGHPLFQLAVFALANVVMIWRLHAMESKGFEGTVLGTLIMPYCSGFANLVFAFVMAERSLKTPSSTTSPTSHSYSVSLRCSARRRSRPSKKPSKKSIRNLPASTASTCS